jgi:transposase
MGLTLRIYIVKDDNTLERLPLNKYERLLDRDPNELIPRYAGKRIQYAAVVVDLVNRKPVDILRTQYSYLTFASDGRLDTKVLRKEGNLAANMILPSIRDRNQPGLIDASHRFAKKQFDHEYKWEPTPHIESAIFEAVFGK